MCRLMVVNLADILRDDGNSRGYHKNVFLFQGQKPIQRKQPVKYEKQK